MTCVRRVFVEKVSGYDVKAQNLLKDIKSTLGLQNLTGLRLIYRYDVEGLTAADFERAVYQVFSEINTDKVYFDLPEDLPAKNISLEYVPGQFDQAADSAAQCIALMTRGERPFVGTARIYAFEGGISLEDFDEIKNYLINPVERREAKPGLPKTIKVEAHEPPAVKSEVDFIKLEGSQLEAFHSSRGFAMSLEDLTFVRNYFRDEEKRDPTVTELKMIDTYWSDHCRHTTFFTKLEEIEIEEGALSAAIEEALQNYLAVRAEVYGQKEKDISLMDLATIATKAMKKRGELPDLDESDEINACSIEREIEIDGQKQTWLIQFKNETHNHPTEIEPFGGAATCLGGAIRDPLSGRAYVYQAMRISGAGDPNTAYKETLEGKLPQKTITVTAAQGYASYGNHIGVATGHVAEFYDPGYIAKRMELGAVVAACPKSNVRREKPQEGDVIILLGGKTGRDGVGGATGSSKAHESDADENYSAEVQKGNPMVERYIQRLFRKPKVSNLIKKCNDFGAGGISVAVGELADGLYIELDRVPVKYPGLDGTELALAESQERMAVVVDKNDADTFIKYAIEENLEATLVARVTSTPRLVMNWRGENIVDISRDFLDTNGLTQKARVRISAPQADQAYMTALPRALKGLKGAQALKANMARLQVASQKGLVQGFDFGACASLTPLGGKNQLTPEEAMVAKIPLEKGETDDATVMSFGFMPALSKWSPFHGGAFAVTESLARLAAVGVDGQKARLSMQEYFERLGSDPLKWGKPASALLGALEAQMNFAVPAIGGKDSMSGSFDDLHVPPTLVCFALSMGKASKVGSAALKNVGSRLVLVKLPLCAKSLLPDWSVAKKLFSDVASAVSKRDVTAASLVREGGAAAAVCRMALGSGFGFDFAQNLNYEDLFAPLNSSFVLELSPGYEPKSFEYIELGKSNDRSVFELDGQSISSQELLEAWTSVLEDVFPTAAPPADMSAQVELYKAPCKFGPAINILKPRVLIPVLPGVASEAETAKAFERAGGQAQTFIFKNQNPQDIKESYDEFVKLLNTAQILVLPGGHSACDEPDGAGKFYKTLLEDPAVAAAISDLLDSRQGLALGFSDGFRALLQTGLLPYGKMQALTPTSPSLSLNAGGGHVSQIVYTRLVSKKSPWLSATEPGQVFAQPFSHTYGCFKAHKALIESLAQKGQIATQYVDLEGRPAAAPPYNPSSSTAAVEGILSPDGRVFGKMAYNQRIEPGHYTNQALEEDQKIFQSGVKYFK
ncbi:MAG: phosphoribosylformylglycinamidine synthase [Clostridiales bacterium]|nr:phosphoribosylformylglycinamidine synthase [Clostridiales bacterium]